MTVPHTSSEIAEWLALTEPESSDTPPSEGARALISQKITERDASLALSTISNLLITCFVSPQMQTTLGSPAAVAQYAARLMPKKQWKVQLGDLGEAIALGALEHLQGLFVPVVKLQQRNTSDETQHGIDHVALRVSRDNVLREIRFIECKAGRTMQSRVGVEACAELFQQREEEVEHILNFLMGPLSTTSDDLARQFFDYLTNAGSDSDCSEEQELFFFWDADQWSPSADECLRQCKECPERKQSRAVCTDSRRALVFLRTELADLVEEVYGTFGIEASPLK